MVLTLIPNGEPINPKFNRPLTVERLGDSLTIVGESLDFRVIPVGATLPDAGEATGCPYIVGDIERADSGVLHIKLLFPHGRNAPVEARFPEPIAVTEDGPVELPFADWEV